MANAPLVDEMPGVMALIWVAREAEYFSCRDWTAFADLPVVPIGRSRERQSALALQANQPAAAVWTVNRRHGRWPKTDPNAQTVYGLTPWFGLTKFAMSAMHSPSSGGEETRFNESAGPAHSFFKAARVASQL